MSKKRRPKKRRPEPDANETAFSVIQRVIEKTERQPTPKRKKPRN